MEADELIETIREQVERDRRAKISEARKEDNETRELIPTSQKEENYTRTKIANIFNTNSHYISDAAKIKDTRPEVFERYVNPHNGLDVPTEISRRLIQVIHYGETRSRKTVH